MTEQVVEMVKLIDEQQLGETCVLVEGNKLCFPEQPLKHKSYKVCHPSTLMYVWAHSCATASICVINQIALFFIPRKNFVKHFVQKRDQQGSMNIS